MAENIEFRLKVIEDKLGVVLEQNEKKAKSLGGALQVALGTFASTAVTKGLSLAADGFRTLTDFISSSVDASAESEAALKRLEIALGQTGQLSKETLVSFQDFAAQIQATTAFEDDLVISNIALIQSLARLDSEGLKRATNAALDLSTALGIDLETASRVVAKAAEGNTAALGKLGIEFEKGSTNAQTFSNVLSTIEQRFGGAAQAQVKTFAGTITQLSNIWGDLKENIGAAITQNPAVIAAFGVLRDTVISLSKAISTAFGAVSQDATANFFRLIFDGAAAVTVSLDAIGRIATASVEVALAAIRLLALGLTTPVAATLELLSLIPGIGEAFKGAAEVATAEVIRLSDAYQQNIKGLSEAFTGETFFSKVTDQIADARVNFDLLYNDIKTKSEELKNAPVVGGSSEEQSQQLRQLNSELLAIQNEYYLAANQLDEQNRIAEQERFFARSAEDIKNLQDFELTKSELQFQAAVDRASLTLKGDELRIAKEKALREKELRDLKINNQTKEQIRQQQLKDEQAFFASATSLASSANRNLALIGKAAALTQIAINTPKAISQAYNYGLAISAGNPAVGAALGAIAGAAQAAQAARVAGIQGLAEGGIVGNPSTSTSGPDNTVIKARNGEAVLTADDQLELLRAIRSGSLSQQSGDIVVQVDGREIARAVRTQINNGFRLA